MGRGSTKRALCWPSSPPSRSASGRRKLLYDRPLVLADEHNLPAAYGAHDVALAELLGAALWTADRRPLRALGGRLPFVRWIAEYGA